MIIAALVTVLLGTILGGGLWYLERSLNFKYAYKAQVDQEIFIHVKAECLRQE